MKKVWNLFRWIVGIVFILCGCGFVDEAPIAMVLCIVFGLSLTPLVWKLLNIKRWKKILLQMFVPIILLFATAIFAPTTQSDNIQSDFVQETVTGNIATEKIKETELIVTEAIIPETEPENITEQVEETETEVITEKITETVTEAATEQITEASASHNLTMDVIDVGQGLSLLFESDGHYMLYDGGDRDYSSKVVAYLKNKEIQTLDYVVVSHYDSDHLNGIVGALNVFDVQNVIAPDYDTDTRVFESFKEIIPEKGLELTYPEVGQQYMLGSSQFLILAPNSADYSDENDYSVAIRMECGERSIIVTGDATTLSEGEMLENGQTLDSDILVIGHHGSEGSTSEAFLNAVSPIAAVISCGLNNEYLHPSQRVMELLQQQDIPVLRTDKQGDFVITTDGANIEYSVGFSNDYSYGVEPLVAEEELYATSDVNIRSAMSTDSEVLGMLGLGDKISVVGVDGDWAKVIFNGTVAYVAAAYLSDTEPVAETEQAVSVVAEEQSNTVTYIINANTGKFHYPSCRSVKQMKESNKRESYETRDALVSQGYSPCGNCHP